MRALLRFVCKGWTWKVSLLLVLFVVSCVIRKLQKKRARKTLEKNRKRKQKACMATPAGETIFVSVASYRDPECPLTVFDCLEKAKCPLRVVIGVCQQNYPVDVDVMEGYKKLAHKQGSGD